MHSQSGKKRIKGQRKKGRKPFQVSTVKVTARNIQDVFELLSGPKPLTDFIGWLETERTYLNETAAARNLPLGNRWVLQDSEDYKKWEYCSPPKPLKGTYRITADSMADYNPNFKIG